MKFILNLPLFLLLIAALPVFAQKNIELKSPDSNLVFSFTLTEKAPIYRVAYKGETLIEDSELGLSFQEDGNFGENLNMGKARFSEIDETYELVVGKAKTVRDQHREIFIPLVERNGAKRQINLVVRAFNDGLAFRYEFPEQKNWQSYTMIDEQSTFNIAGGPHCAYAFLGALYQQP